MKKLAAFLLLWLIVLSGCTKSAPKVLHLAVWSNYITPETLKEFESRTGTQVQVSNYSSNEELLAKLQAGASGFDVAVPSDYMVFAMIKLGLLTKLDAAQMKLPGQVDPRFAKRAYDPEGAFSVPYDWGTTGIAVNRGLYGGKITGWKDVFGNPGLKGKYSMLDDGREVLSAGLKFLGKSLNTRKPEDYEAAKREILKIRGELKAFSSEAKTALIKGEVAVAHAYSSDALQARRETAGKVEYIVPAEGGTLWLDNLVIPKGAGNLPDAYRFISFLMEAKTMAQTVRAILVAPSNLEVLPLLPPEIRSDQGLFPPAEFMSKMETMEDLGELSTVIDRAWTEVKAAK